MGVNSRGNALAKSFAQQKDCDVVHICDVDSRAILACQKQLESSQDIKTKGFRDFRESLQDKKIDAMVIATPDHWHAPAALLAMQAGKHVEIEIPMADTLEDAEAICAALVKQLHSPVRWVESINKMSADGVATVIECGPGKVLTGLNKRINKEIQALPVFDAETLNAAIDATK